jgi:serine protease Do
VPIRFFYSFDEFENELLGDESEPKDIIPAPELGDNREEITLEKNEGIQKEEGEKITSAGQAYNSVSEVYYAVSDSVVEITTEVVRNGSWMGQYVSEGAGSGVIIDKRGLIVTNYHVIASASSIVVRLTSGEEFSAAVIGYDESADLAVIKIDGSDRELTVAALGCSADLVVGEDVVAIGNPLGSLGGTLTTGIISATERNITVDGREMMLLQTNAAINPGNSGGGLFNMAGELVGIVNAKMGGSDVEGLGFAIPIDFAHSVMEDLINYGYVKGVADHGLILLDVTADNLPAAYSKYGISTTGVVVLESKLTDQLKHGDVVISVNGVKISSSSRFDAIVKSCKVGEKITVSVKRGGEAVSVTYTLGERGANTVDFN